MAAVQASITMLAAVEVGEAAEFGLHGLPQGLADDPELRMFDDLPIVERTEVRTATAGQRVLDEDAAAKDKAADVFLVQQNDADSTGGPPVAAWTPPGGLRREWDHL